MINQFSESNFPRSAAQMPHKFTREEQSAGGKKSRGSGRPVTANGFTTKKAQKFLELLKKGHTVTDSCQILKTTRGSLGSWIRKHPEFREEKLKAQEEGIDYLSDTTADVEKLSIEYAKTFLQNLMKDGKFVDDMKIKDVTEAFSIAVRMKGTPDIVINNLNANSLNVEELVKEVRSELED